MWTTVAQPAETVHRVLGNPAGMFQMQPAAVGAVVSAVLKSPVSG